jgi:hypothetical protein
VTSDTTTGLVGGVVGGVVAGGLLVLVVVVAVVPVDTVDEAGTVVDEDSADETTGIEVDEPAPLVVDDDFAEPPELQLHTASTLTQISAKRARVRPNVNASIRSDITGRARVCRV